LMSVLLPIIRADFAMCENYFLQDCYALRTPISALAGSEDLDVPVTDVEAWGHLTTSDFRITRFSGDHFFIRSNEAEVVAAVSNDLRDAK
jgi:medium-chain acyl-[acyl-carrier-protein] hydrolase